MPVAIPNYSYAYKRKGKPVFAPSRIGKRIGKEIKNSVERAYTFDSIYFHLRKGGHVAALHHHRSHNFFARIDISNFFYSISRRRVQSALDRVGVGNARFYAKWSTVANPNGDPKYALPYGFVQSPILASLVLATSDLGQHLVGLPTNLKAAVYVDDISLSADNEQDLQQAFDATLTAIENEGFSTNARKLRTPAREIDIFNCDLSKGQSVVRNERIAAFQATAPNLAAKEGFTEYCASVEAGNQP